MPRRIIYHYTQCGGSPVQDFIDGLSVTLNWQQGGWKIVKKHSVIAQLKNHAF